MLTGPAAQQLALVILSVMKSVLIGSDFAKAKFREKIGYSHFVATFRRLGEPTKDVLLSILELIVEDDYRADCEYVIRNVQAVLILVQWLPFIQSHDLQLWLAECLQHVCCGSAHNRLQCCNEGVIGKLLETLGQHKRYCSTLGQHRRYCNTLGQHKRYCSTIGKHRRYCTALGRHKQYCSTLGQHKRYCNTFVFIKLYFDQSKIVTGPGVYIVG